MIWSEKQKEKELQDNLGSLVRKKKVRNLTKVTIVNIIFEPILTLIAGDTTKKIGKHDTGLQN